MKVTEHISNSTSTFFSLEILPPLKGDGIKKLFDHLDPLMEFKPPFIDVTYHREEQIYKRRENGLLERKSIRKRPGTVGICAAIQNRYKVDTVPHMICGGFTIEETENALVDLHYLGIENVLAIRGDAKNSDNRFIPEPGGHDYAIELVNQIVQMNSGSYLHEELENAYPTEFCVGVAGYPEKHFESPNLRSDMKHLKEKVDAGADYIVTQMFFDNSKYFEFVKQCKDSGINVPIIPGIKPITTLKQMTILPSIFHIDLPEDLSVELEKCKDNKAATEVGVEWCVQQSKELVEFGAPCLHYYSMGKAEPVGRIASQVF